VESALKAFRDLYHRIEAHYCGSMEAFDLKSFGGADADSLLHQLLVAREATEARMKRLRQGTPLPEDRGPRSRI
jgi:hypothetical protein